jgi:predicted DNA-binding ribbon-helix-helix protein
MPKQKLTLSTDKEIINQAKGQNINLSSFLEIRLIDYLSYKEKCSRRDSPLIVKCPSNINSFYEHQNHYVIMLQMLQPVIF